MAGYMLKADPDKMRARGLEYGWAPIQPIFEGKEYVKSLPGHVFPDQEFEWEGDPNNPPRWCSPLDEVGELAYKKQAERDKRKKSHRREMALAKRQAELDALRAELAAKDGPPLDAPAPAAAQPAKKSHKAKAKAPDEPELTGPYSDLSGPELRALVKERGLAVDGDARKRADMVKALQASDALAPEPASTE